MDPRGLQSKFYHFNAVSANNRMPNPTLGVVAPSLEILDPPLKTDLITIKIHELAEVYFLRNIYLKCYRSGTVNSNTVNSKFHLSYCEIFFYNFPNIPFLKYTVNSNFHLIRSKTLPTNDFELTVPTCNKKVLTLRLFTQHTR